MWVVNAGQWNGPARITGVGYAPAGAAVTTGPQYGIDGQTDLFFVDGEGAVNVMWVVNAGQWNGPARL